MLTSVCAAYHIWNSKPYKPLNLNTYFSKWLFFKIMRYVRTGTFWFSATKQRRYHIWYRQEGSLNLSIRIKFIYAVTSTQQFFNTCMQNSSIKIHHSWYLYPIWGDAQYEIRSFEIWLFLKKIYESSCLNLKFSTLTKYALLNFLAEC